MTSIERVEDLPKSIQDVGEIFGLALVLKLVHHFGGCELKIPHAVKDQHPLVQALGREDAEALCGLIGGGELYVPKMTRKRRSDVEALAASGMSRAQIARALGIAQRHVRRLANGKAKPAGGRKSGGRHSDDQSDLFGD